jgi:hypothetical protein
MAGESAGATKPNRFGAVAAERKAPTPTPGSSGEKMSKYTILLSPRVATELDEDVLRLRRQTGRKIDKSEIIRALVQLLHSDESLFNEVVGRLTGTTPS